MSKIKDIEKTNIEKHKDFKIEKIEKPELKEKPEKREHKEIKEPWKEKLEKFEQKETKELKQEHKEKPERKEFKEPIKEKFENKEIKELEKQVFEKGGKEIAENIDLGGEVLNPRAAAAGGGEAFSSDAFSEMSAASAAKPKETDKAPVKDIEKVKPEKEQLEKVQKDIEKVKPEKEQFKHELKDHKIEKLEHKEFKFEKHEIKDLKIEITEKHLQKDFLPEKHVFENDPKGIAENPQGGPVFDPTTRGALFSATGTPAERLQQLEDAVTKLSHFIGVDLRPDLSGGALKSEPDVASGGTGDAKSTDDAKTEDKGKKPGGR